MHVTEHRSRVFPLALGTICLLLAGHQFAQAPALSIAPASATIVVGQTIPFSVTGAVGPVNVSAGGEYTCATMPDGTARCAGRNQFGQLGDGSWTNHAFFVAPSGLVSTSQVVAGDEFSCALLSDGTAACWGLGEKGQRGDGTFDQVALSPVPVQGLTNAIALSAGYDHACALLADQTMRCWGSNDHGQLGDPSRTGSAVPIPVPNVGGVQAIAVGAFHTCALLADTTVECWGYNTNGQLGDGTTTDAYTPVAVGGLTNVTALAAGGWHTCALLSDSSLQCWGDNYEGQLGDGTGVPSAVPVQVSGITNAVQIVAGWTHTCARLADATAQCWGEGTAGQLGNGTTQNATAPTSVVGIANAVGLSAGWWQHSCALLADATLRCWGANNWGQFGDGTATGSVVPVPTGAPGVTWTSSDPGIATIDGSGRATAVAPGVVTITATDIAGSTASATLSVKPPHYTLTVVTAGTSASLGSVTSDPAGINCGSDCSEDYVAGTVVTLTASPGPLLMSWNGCDSASGNVCTVTMGSARSVTATFVGMQQP